MLVFLNLGRKPFAGTWNVLYGDRTKPCGKKQGGIWECPAEKERAVGLGAARLNQHRQNDEALLQQAPSKAANIPQELPVSSLNVTNASFPCFAPGR